MERVRLNCLLWALHTPYPLPHTPLLLKQVLTSHVCPSSYVSLVLYMQFPVSMSVRSSEFHSWELFWQFQAAGTKFPFLLKFLSFLYSLTLCAVKPLSFFKSFFKLSAFQYYLTIKEAQLKPSCFLFQLRLCLLHSSRNVFR